jgi:hypothetical protein
LLSQLPHEKASARENQQDSGTSHLSIELHVAARNLLAKLHALAWQLPAAGLLLALHAYPNKPKHLSKIS